MSHCEGSWRCLKTNAIKTTYIKSPNGKTVHYNDDVTFLNDQNGQMAIWRFCLHDGRRGEVTVENRGHNLGRGIDELLDKWT